jgi:hypothetical protein
VPHRQRPFPADGFDAVWTSVEHGSEERLSLRWDNEAWTASGQVERHDVEYVLRLSPLWEIRQFLLFRDLELPDLWLGTDGSGRWGEVNGAHRPELDGAYDLTLDCTPFTYSLPIRRLPIRVGHAADIRLLVVDVETLGVITAEETYERVATDRWRVTRDGASVEFDVDEFGLPLDVPARFRRTA